jgi:SAM-dependent methyltransferase
MFKEVPLLLSDDRHASISQGVARCDGNAHDAKRAVEREEMINEVLGRNPSAGVGSVEGPRGGRPPVDSALVTAIIEVTRELARSVPPPRGAPYFYLDVVAAYDLRVFDALCARGIFRKYEFALDIGSGLGGRARWLAERSGCRIMGVDPRPSAVVGAARLNRRAHMDDQLTFQVGRSDALPLRERLFTHVWWLEAVHGPGVHPTLAEAFRVLRRGGHLALQTAGPPAGQLNGFLDALAATGFIEPVVCETPLPDVPDAVRIARDRLGAALHRVGMVFEGVAELATRPPAANCLQIFARRPA